MILSICRPLLPVIARRRRRRSNLETAAYQPWALRRPEIATAAARPRDDVSGSVEAVLIFRHCEEASADEAISC